MISRLILFELRFWSRQPLVWVFLGLAFAFACALAVFESGAEGSPGMVHVNSPLHVYDLYANLAFLWLPMVTAFVNATAIRDFAHRTSDIVFSTMVTRRQYLIGRFLGSTLVALAPTLGISAGLVVGSWIPYGDAIRFGPNSWVVHGQAFLWFALSSILLQSAVMFAAATFTRSTAAAFVTSIALLVMNVMATAYATEVDNAWLASLLDPFGVQALDEVTRYWSVHDSNTSHLPLTGALARNRLLWSAMAVCIFLVGYGRFSFSERRTSARPVPDGPTPPAMTAELPVTRRSFGGLPDAKSFGRLLRSDLTSIVRSPVFWVIVGLGLLMCLVALSEVDQAFGNRSWPVTYNITELLRGLSMLFIVVLITYYSGELYWRDRDMGLDGIAHALPVRSRHRILSHLTAVLIVGGLVLVLMSLAGMATQLAMGYTRLQAGLYLVSFIGPGLVAFAFWCMLALAVQMVVHHKYAGFGLFVVLFAVNTLIWRFLKVESNLIVLYGSPRLWYSDMNGFGPFLMPWLFFKAYWLAFASVLFFGGALLLVRGGETTWRWRSRIAGGRLRRSWPVGAVLCGVWLAFLGLGLYNTRILNEPHTRQDTEALQVAYERTYKPMSNTALPHVTAVDITIDLDPEARAISYHAKMTLTNKGPRAVDTLWFGPPDRMKLRFDIPGARDVLNDSALFVRMFRLDEPLATGDSIRIGVASEWRQQGFGNDVDFLELVENGTFINNNDLLPTTGYQADAELMDPGARRKHSLPPNRRMDPLSDDPHDRRFSAVMPYADHIRFSCTIGTAPDQTAIAPGDLKREWRENGMRWFRYESATPIFNFWSVLSARYRITREEVDGVMLEVYHHPEHGSNVQRMLKAMRDAIGYASSNFSPYQHKVARIIEFPRYRGFAQSFPGTMPYSEAIGFITDLRDTARIDMVHYVVAHEVAHQWWGHQVLGPRMQGSTMMNESMAQYTALMVLEKEYGRAAMRKFLKYERDTYLRGRGKEGIGELPLMKVENQQHIHYSKGSVVMYGLKDLIGEERVNAAYRAFVDSFAFQGSPYPTTLDLYRSLEAVTPDSLRYLLEDGLKHITFHRNAVTSTKAERNADGSWTVAAVITCAKLHADPLGKETEVPMNDWLDVAVEQESGETKQRVRSRSGENSVRMTVPRKPKAVVVDPDHLFFDREVEDDRRAVD
ncbi:MAG: hypothetical protein IPJ87_02920 [Flavobacteriales bacterium]|nr:hypothetical protein [Flavobacteriales bacterium]MBK7940820.1 hypothetical protein [Flavobacteriales bacterium]